MSTDDGPRRGTQRSVAELLAAYSAETPQAPSRRRPEQAPPPPPEPPAPTAGYPAPGPETGTGYTPSYGGADPYGHGYGGPASDPGYGSSTGYVPPPAPTGYPASPYGASPYPAQAPTAYTPAPPPPPAPPPQAPPPQAPPPQTPPPQPPTAYTPPPPPGPPPGWGTAAVPAPAAPPSPGIADGGPPTSASAFVGHDDDEDDDGFYRVDERERPGPVAPGGGGTAMLAAPDAAPAGLDDDRNDLDDEYDEYDEYDDEAEYDDAPRSGVREWAILVAQLLAGAVLGAVLWTVFSFLWGSVPIVALVLALAATTGLVFGVRALRRSDDLQTTLLAVFVGLVVTVSPATVALLGN